ncbi:hypothetical protein [Cohnella terricola]|uniref:Uncharacterized protein n=1 Tax=Cohnella terricola TaxID=1289167 RepID=A0A559JW33_9BACL|nr:hypothetical protein [Cohnella terricola]TVY04104.1 hypothetical protein FPZ45_00405 [Cohnella terricola]
MAHERQSDSHFVFSERLGIEIPSLQCDWDELDSGSQTVILTRWELIRGSIPDRIMGFEAVIRVKQQLLFEEDDFTRSCLLNGEIADLASRINDLNIWFRAQQELNGDAKQHAG